MSKGNYAVGQQTKQRILKESRRLFYRNGLRQTTYDDISEAAGVNRALIPYYFKSKFQLGREVYLEVIQEFYDAFEKAVQIGQYSQIMRTNLSTFAYYRVLKNPKFCRLAEEIQTDAQYFERMVRAEKKFILDYVKEEQQICEEDLEILATMDFGIEKEIVRMARKREGALDTDHICSMELRMILQYCGYPREQVDHMIVKTLEILEPMQITVRAGFKMQITF